MPQQTAHLGGGLRDELSEVSNLGGLEVDRELLVRVVDAETAGIVRRLCGGRRALRIGQRHIPRRIELGVAPGTDTLGEHVERPVGAVSSRAR